MEKEVILDTVKKMLASGIDEETIKATLGDVGLSPEEADDLILKASALKQPARKPVEEPETPSEEIARKTAERVKEHLAAPKEELERVAAELGITAEEQKAALEEHAGRLEGIEEGLGEVKEVITRMPGTMDERIKDIEVKISELDYAVKDLKALSQAMQEVLKKILDTNRNVLLELQRKR